MKVFIVFENQTGGVHSVWLDRTQAKQMADQMNSQDQKYQAKKYYVVLEEEAH